MVCTLPNKSTDDENQKAVCKYQYVQTTLKQNADMLTIMFIISTMLMSDVFSLLKSNTYWFQ